jgi:predicted alpha/beta hydrolase family esterase
MDAPFFESGEAVDYKNWEKVFDGLDVASYDTWITHSMGAKMARQYIVSKGLHIKRMILVAPRYESSTRASMEQVEKEQLTHTYEELRSCVDEIIVIKSEDDPGAPYVSGKKVAEATGGKLITVNGAGHFNVEYSPFITGIILHGAPLRRIPEVLDVWMDSASMPYAQVHYPFENQAKMEASFPADFIAEYTGQIRAWFYVMHAIGVMVK